MKGMASVTETYAELLINRKEGMKEMFYLMMHLTHYIYGHMSSDIWQRITQRERKPAAIITWATLSD